MPLELTSPDVEGIKKVPTFRRLTITQADDGTMSADVEYRVQLMDSEGNALAELPPATAGFSHAQLVAHPDFATVYPKIRDLSRSGLLAVHPELVSQS